MLLNDVPALESSQCSVCRESLEPLGSVHVQRRCRQCGRLTFVVEPGKRGEGIEVRAGDIVMVGERALRMSLDSRQATGKFTRPGIHWFVKNLLFSGTSMNDEEYGSLLDAYENECEEFLKASSLLTGLDLDNQDDSQRGFEVLQQNEYTPEWWASITGAMSLIVKDAIADNNARRAAWAASHLSTAHAMLVYARHLEDLLWRGYQIGNLRDVLQVWDAHRDNGDEEFWQTTLASHAIVVSQLFAFPVVIIQQKAYVGGTRIDGSGASIADFLVTNQLTANAALIEIKTPTTRLLGSKYRGTYNVSRDITGATIQVLGYKDMLLKDATRIQSNSNFVINAVDPQCIVIAGNLTRELDSQDKRRAFEIFRRNLKDVQVVTYDEVFGRVAHLVGLLEGVSVKGAASGAKRR